jgi:hypothetical protein
VCTHLLLRCHNDIVQPQLAAAPTAVITLAVAAMFCLCSWYANPLNGAGGIFVSEDHGRSFTRVGAPSSTSCEGCGDMVNDFLAVAFDAAGGYLYAGAQRLSRLSCALLLLGYACCPCCSAKCVLLLLFSFAAVLPAAHTEQVCGNCPCSKCCMRGHSAHGAAVLHCRRPHQWRCAHQAWH